MVVFQYMLGLSCQLIYVNRELPVDIKRTCEANAAGENSSFIFTVCVKSVGLYYLKLIYVVLHMAIKEFFETHA